MCPGVCLGLYQAYAHCDWCEAIDSCIRVCVWAFTTRVLTVIDVKQCMRHHAVRIIVILQMCICTPQPARACTCGHNDSLVCMY